MVRTPSAGDDEPAGSAIGSIDSIGSRRGPDLTTERMPARRRSIREVDETGDHG